MAPPRLASTPEPVTFDRNDRSLSSEMAGHLPPKQLDTLARRTQWVEAVELSNGSTLSADLCLVAAGIRPNAALAESAGLVVRRGEVVDDRMCTSDPHIFAAGDAVEFGERPLGL